MTNIWGCSQLRTRRTCLYQRCAPKTFFVVETSQTISTSPKQPYPLLLIFKSTWFLRWLTLCFKQTIWYVMNLFIIFCWYFLWSIFCWYFFMVNILLIFLMVNILLIFLSTLDTGGWKTTSFITFASISPDGEEEDDDDDDDVDDKGCHLSSMHCKRRRGCFSTNHHHQQSTWSTSLGMPYPTNSAVAWLSLNWIL